MLQKDYFIRLIEEFAIAIQRFLEKAEGKRTDEDLKELYREYVGLFQDLRNLSAEEAVDYACQTWEASQQMPRLEMLAELWYVEASYKQQPLKDVLLEKALRLFQYVDRHSTEYSLVRLSKMDEITKLLG
jgi:hypothetical protein